MTATRQRFWVEVTPHLGPAAPDCPTVLPRLTPLAAAARLEGAELDAELASVHRQMSALAAYRAGLIDRKAALGAQQPLPFAPGARTDTRPDADPDDPSLQAADDFLADEVAVLLTMSVGSARYLVDDDLTLVRQLPAVWHALADQRIDEARAKAIVRALRYVAVSWGGPVADAVVDAIAARAVDWAAAGCAPTTLKERIEAALIAADPEAADRRKQLRKRGAGVRVQGTGDGLADLHVTHLDVADGKLVKAQLAAFARARQAEGDSRPRGEIETDLVVGLITRPWEKQDPALAHLTINADLADLLVPDLSDLIAAAQADAASAATRDDAARDTAARNADENDAGLDAEHPADSAAVRKVGGGGITPHDTGAGAGVGADLPDVGTDGAEEGWAGAALADEDQEGEDGRSGDPVSEEQAGDDREFEDRGLGDEAGDGSADDPDVEVDGGRPPCTTNHGTGLPTGGSRVGHVGGLPVTPSAVRTLLTWTDALGLTHPAGGGDLAFTITGQRGRLLAVATPEELAAAAKAGRGLGPPPAAPGYTPTAAQYRYLRARDRHCRFPGCRQVARACDADHVTPYDHRNPTEGGPTCVRNLAMLCRRHHRLKTHAHGWRFQLDPDGTLHVTTPGGTIRTTRPPALGEVLDLSTDPPPPYDPADDPPPF